MKVALKSVLTLIVIPLALAFAVEVLSPFAPETLPALQRWVAAVTDWAGFPWVLAGSLGLLAGMWLDRVAGVFDGRYPVRTGGKAKLLAGDVEAVGQKFIEIFGPGVVAKREDPWPLVARAGLLKVKLERLGVVFPVPHGPDQVFEQNRILGRQLRIIVPSLREGDVPAANAILIQAATDGDRLDAEVALYGPELGPMREMD